MEIRNRWTGAVQINSTCSSLREAVIEALKKNVNLRGAYLCDAYLRGAYLCDANLCDADLRGAYLCDAKSGSVCRMDFGGWSICIREEQTSIGCQTHPNEMWLKWRARDKAIQEMHSQAAEWWTMHGPAVKAAIKVVMKKAKMK